MGREKVNGAPKARAEKDGVAFDNGLAKQGGRCLNEAFDWALPGGIRVAEEVLELTDELLSSAVTLDAVGADRLADGAVFKTGLVEEAFSVHDCAYADGTPWFNMPGAEEDAVKDLHAPHFPVASKKRPGNRGTKFLYDGGRGESPAATI